MKRKTRYIARLDEVTITREGENAIIAYHESGVPTTHMTIGPEITELTDQDILDLHNNHLRAVAKRAAEYQHVVVEVPLGSPQVQYHEDSDQWIPRGSVLRCALHDEDNLAVVEVDDHEFTMEEFGRLLVTYAGWGMRIEFVPEDEIHRRPKLEVREPKDQPEDGL